MPLSKNIFLPEIEIGIPSHKTSSVYPISDAVFPTEYIIRQSTISAAAEVTAEDTAIPRSTYEKAQFAPEFSQFEQLPKPQYPQ